MLEQTKTGRWKPDKNGTKTEVLQKWIFSLNLALRLRNKALCKSSFINENGNVHEIKLA